jgi:hypothetical protein
LSSLKDIKKECFTPKLLSIISTLALDFQKIYQDLIIYLLKESINLLKESNSEDYDLVFNNYKTLVSICSTKSESLEYFESFNEYCFSIGINIKKISSMLIEWFAIEAWNNGVYYFRYL